MSPLPKSLHVFWFNSYSRCNNRQDSDVRRPCQIRMRKLIPSCTSTTPYPKDANRRYRACSLVSARHDYANSLLYGVTAKNITKLQMVQNLARVVTGLQRRDHITSALKRLNWLPIKSHIDFKIATLTFKDRSTNQPAYLESLISSYHPGRSLRSADYNCLTVPHITTSASAKAFSTAAPLIWNDLSNYIITSPSFDSFRQKLKAHLFAIAFGQARYIPRLWFSRKTLTI